MTKKVKRDLTLGELISWTKGNATFSDTLLSKSIQDIWMDSRKIKKGDVFLALASEGDDGHRYIDTACAAGASAVICDRRKTSMVSEKYRSRLILVSDPLTAVSKAAAEYRKKLDIPVIAVTGSNGKTTTRRFIDGILSTFIPVGSTSGNWNNHIGVPLSILRLTGNEQMGVFEIGTNHPGEIAPLSKIVKPDAVVVTNIGYAHIGNFKTVAEIAQEKLSIADGMPAKDKLILLNGDDKASVKYNTQNALYFGTSTRCGIRAEDLTCDKNGIYSFTLRGDYFTMPMPGRHFVYSVLPAFFFAYQLGLTGAQISEALATLTPEATRGLIEERSGMRFIVDCYNANPSSMNSSLTMLEDVTAKGRRCAVLGDMLEMGSYRAKVHTELGKVVAHKGVESLIAVGNESDRVIASAVAAGLDSKKCAAVATAVDAVAVAKKLFKKGDTVLIKGSRSIGLEKFYEGFAGNGTR